jgi:tetratricopeptide (TPR) repeat protein
MEQLFTEAIANWKLSELYHDLAVIKGHALTDWEKTCLRGLLCRYSPKYISQKTYWTVNALRTELSRRLYRYIEGLIQQQISHPKISWSNIADSLDQLGYRKVSTLSSNLALPVEIELAISVVPVSKVIASITKLSLVSQQLAVEDNLLEDIKILSLANRLIKEGSLNLRQQQYAQSLQCYYRALVASTSIDINVLVNIATCYDRLSLSGDSLALCYFMLGFLPNNPDEHLVSVTLRDESRYKIHTFIGDIFRSLAAAEKDPSYLNIALKHYDLAICHNSLDINPLRQQLDMILTAISNHNFSEIDRQRYLDLARKKINKLLKFSSARNLEQTDINEQTLPRHQSAVK